MDALEYMRANIESADARTVRWRLEVFNSEYKARDLMHAIVEIASERLLEGRSPDTEIEYIRCKQLFRARIKAVSADDVVDRFTRG